MTLVNVLLCLAGMWMCVCRARHMSFATTRNVVRYGYGAMFTTLLGSLLVFPAGWWQTYLSFCIVVYLLKGMPAWRGSQPEEACK